ncbi:hypothetical protein NECAME_01831 [Necator americanus]|uniref:Uncharacterized protein n=1 Tax=Necator americanus TaxID=51031 RepID=W2TPU3_NECAM|nr:hypothetical protein NECAME_01831 [Necator americanus]ETN83032.1 hypothetical protein NECAME_01831 [Necator americanus]
MRIEQWKRRILPENHLPVPIWLLIITLDGSEEASRGCRGEEPFVDGEAAVQNSIVPVESDSSEDVDGYDERDDAEEET